MKILITGANGLLGQKLVEQLIEKGHSIIGISRGPQRIISASPLFIYKDLDITDGPAIESFIIDEKPEIIIHAAAMTQVDQCELDKQECYNINVTATRFIIAAAKACSSKFVYVSTDFIFDGSAGPYKEEDEPAPVNYYGSTKLVAEKEVMESGLDWAIARTVLVYGVAPTTGRSNIISFIKQNIEQGKTVRMVTDQWRTPTFVDDLATGIVLIIDKKEKGIFNISGEEGMTPFEIGIATAKYFNIDENLVQPALSPDIKQPAQRPARTGFDISKAKKELGFKPHTFQQGLQKIFT